MGAKGRPTTLSTSLSFIPVLQHVTAIQLSLLLLLLPLPVCSQQYYSDCKCSVHTYTRYAKLYLVAFTHSFSFTHCAGLHYMLFILSHSIFFSLLFLPNKLIELWINGNSHLYLSLLQSASLSVRIRIAYTAHSAAQNIYRLHSPHTHTLSLSRLFFAVTFNLIHSLEPTNSCEFVCVCACVHLWRYCCYFLYCASFKMCNFHLCFITG